MPRQTDLTDFLNQSCSSSCPSFYSSYAGSQSSSYDQIDSSSNEDFPNSIYNDQSDISSHASTVSSPTSSSSLCLTRTIDRRGLKSSQIWEFYDKMRDEKSKIIIRARCKYCLQDIAPKPKTSMLQHTKKCKETILSTNKHKYTKIVGSRNGDISSIFKRVNGSNLRVKADLALFRYILGTGVPFSTIDSPLFKDVLKAVSHCPGYDGISRRKLMEFIPEFYDSTKTVIPGYITLTLDGWTKRGNEEIYGINLTTHKEEKLHDILALKGEAATSANLLNLVEQHTTSINYRLIVAFVTDGARNMTLLRRLFTERYPHVMHITCIVHSLNLLCKSILDNDSFKDTISKVLSINASFNKSNKLSEKLKQLRFDGGNKQYTLTSIASTRFCTIYLCAEKLVSFQNDIKKVSSDPDIKWTDKITKNLIADDVFWSEARELCNIIKPIYEILKYFESKKVTLSDCFINFYLAIIQTIKYLTSSACFSGSTSSVYNIISQMCKNYIQDDIFLLCTFLDPTYNIKFNDVTIKRIKNKFIKYVCSWCVEGDDSSKSMFIEHFNSYCEIRDIIDNKYWEKQEKNTYLVGLIAKKLLAIVPHSMACERSFSIMGWINSARRNRISAENLKMATSIYMNLRNSHYNTFENENTKEMIEDTWAEEFSTYQTLKANEFKALCVEEGRGFINDEQSLASLKSLLSNMTGILQHPEDIFSNFVRKSPEIDEEVGVDILLAASRVL